MLLSVHTTAPIDYRRAGLPCPRCIGGSIFRDLRGEHSCFQCGYYGPRYQAIDPHATGKERIPSKMVQFNILDEAASARDDAQHAPADESEISIMAAATLLDTPARWVSRYISSGELHGRMTPNGLVLPRAEVEAFAERRKAGKSQEPTTDARPTTEAVLGPEVKPNRVRRRQQADDHPWRKSYDPMRVNGAVTIVPDIEQLNQDAAAATMAYVIAHREYQEHIAKLDDLGRKLTASREVMEQTRAALDRAIKGLELPSPKAG